MSDKSADAQRPRMPWKVYEGAAWGCGVKTIQTAVPPLPSGFPTLALIDQAFEKVFKAQLSEQASRIKNPEEALLYRFLQWSHEIQRFNKVPVGKEYRILSTPASGRATQVALTSAHPRATRIAFQALYGTFPKLLKASRSESTLIALFNALQNDVSPALESFAPRGQNRSHFMQIALDRGIPFKLDTKNHHVFGCGTGAVRLASSATEFESPIALKIARDKYETGRVLRLSGLPGAENQIIKNEDHLLSVADTMGFPLVVKAQDLDGGRGIYADIKSPEALKWAYQEARKHSPNILLEKHFEGWGHRIAVFEGHLLSASRKVPGGVTGDGENSIAALVKIKNDERAQKRDATSDHHAELSLDTEALGMLKEQDLTPETVLPEGEFLALRRKNNAIVGGETISLEPEDVHPDNLQLCIDAAQCLGLKMAGVDLLISDVSVSWQESGALICEMNGMPQFGFPAAQKFMEVLFAGYRPPKIQIVLTEQPEAIDWVLLEKELELVGADLRVTLDQVIEDGVPRKRDFDRYFDAARAAIFNNKYDSMICVLPLEEALALGLPVKKIDRLICLVEDAQKPGKKMRAAQRLLSSHCDETKIISL